MVHVTIKAWLGQWAKKRKNMTSSENIIGLAKV